MIRAALISIALIAPGAVAAQTMAEAARSNTALAIRLCADVMLNRSQPRAIFTAAGFAYRGIDRGTNDRGIALGLDHYFDAPADTAKSKVDDPEQAAGSCQVLTSPLPQSEVESLVAGILPEFGGTMQPLSHGMTGWSLQHPGTLPLIVQTYTIGTNNRYEAPGTVQVSMSFPG